MRKTNSLAWLVAGLVLGALIVLAVRFFSYKPAESVHYHANFSLYINGQQEKFKNPIYYTEEAATCNTSSGESNPKERVHMHDGIYDVIHVEAPAVTWGQFFENLGWVIDNKLIESPTQMYLADEQHPIHFILNGQVKDYISNLVIGDKDRLLIDYGTAADSQLQKEFSAVAKNASKYDTEPDPMSCSGSKKAATNDRLRHLF